MAVFIKYHFLFILCLSFLSLNSQNNPSVLKNEFAKLQEETNTYFQNNPSAKGYKQWKRKEWFLEPRLFGESRIENIAQKTWAAYESFARKAENNRATHGSWSFIGPISNNTGQGRVNSIAINPNNKDIIYVGSSNGGVWKSTSGGISWLNKSPNIPLLAVADIKLNPSNPNEVFLLTGDGDAILPNSGNFAHGQQESRSIGILKSIDGGNTWYPTNFSLNQALNFVPTKLLIHPSNVNIQYIASNTGLLRTEDQWLTYDTITTDLTYDIEFNTGNNDIVYASGNNWIRRSTNGGVNWDLITDADFSILDEYTRIELAVTPDNINVVYAIAGSNHSNKGVFLSTSNGTTDSWQHISTPYSFGDYAMYCIAIEVNPNDWTMVFAGYQWICKSINNGVNWSHIDQDVVHADIHDIKYIDGSLFVACDGGLYKSDNDGATWTELFNGLGITEIYRMSGTPQSAQHHLIGTQDNGTMEKISASHTFSNPGGGDGMTNHINPTNPLIKYLSRQNGTIFRTTDGINYNHLSSLPTGNAAWVTPFVFDASANTRMFVGKSDIYRSENGFDDWQTLNSPTYFGEVNCMAICPNNENKLYASSSNNIAWTSLALSSSPTIFWQNIGAGLPDLFITDIAVNPDNDAEIFVTLSGYSDGERVYKSNNSGASWINISGSLPAVPINTIAYHDNGLNNDALYIGTDVGVFYRNNDIGDWIFYSNLMPVAIVTDLYINDNYNTISASTYGRGLWKSSLYDGCDANYTLSSIGGGVRYYSASNTITSNAVLPMDFGNEIYLKGGNSVSLTPGFNAGGYSIFNAKIGPCPNPVNNLMNKDQYPQSNFVMSEEFYRKLMEQK